MIVLASESRPLCSVTLAEVLATSDLPGGVVNILTGNREELLPFMVSHMNVNSFVASDLKPAEKQLAREESISNLKRIVLLKDDPAQTELRFAPKSAQKHNLEPTVIRHLFRGTRH